MRKSFRKPKFKFKYLFQFLFFCLLVMGIYFVMINVAPYYKFVAFLSGILLSFQTIALWDKIIISLIAIAFWAILQLAELFPLLLMKNSVFLKKIINKDSALEKYEIKKGDESTIKAMKKAYNSLPVSFVRDLKTIGACAYPIDFLINCFINPPLRGDVWRVIFGRTDLIDWGNILLNVWIVVVVQVIVVFLLWTWVMIQVYQYD